MRARRAGLPLIVTVPLVGSTRSPITRSSVDLPHPDGPISETNSPASSSSSMSWSAVTFPCANVFVTSWMETTLILVAPSSLRSCDVLRCAVDDELLDPDHDQEEDDPERGRDDVRRPELL